MHLLGPVVPFGARPEVKSASTVTYYIITEGKAATTAAGSGNVLIVRLPGVFFPPDFQVPLLPG